jgi:hypothetical protein
MKNEGALRMRFFRYGGIYRSDVSSLLVTLGRGSRFPVRPVPGYRTRRKEHGLPIVRDEFRPAIPQRDARQHCPSPLHRHHQLNTIAASNGIIYHRTVNSLLTVCLTHRDNPMDKHRFCAFTLGYSRDTSFSVYCIDGTLVQISPNEPLYLGDVHTFTLPIDRSLGADETRVSTSGTLVICFRDEGPWGDLHVTDVLQRCFDHIETKVIGRLKRFFEPSGEPGGEPAANNPEDSSLSVG